MANEHWAICGLFTLSVVSITSGIHVELQKPVYEVAKGDPVTLTCEFKSAKPNNPLVIITWTGDHDDPKEPHISIATYYSSGQLDIFPDYRDKVKIETDVSRGVSTLTFSQVTPLENRIFQCKVQIPGDDVGQPSDTTQLVVLIAPSPPICKVLGTAEYGHDISLTCMSEEGSPTPTYKWQSYDVKNIPRPFPPKTTEKDGVLSLFNVSMETSGYYICTSANKIRSVTCNLTLSTMPTTMKFGATLGILGGCVAGVVVLIILIYCCCCRKKKEPEYTMAEPEVVEFQEKPPLGKVKDDFENESKMFEHQQTADATAMTVMMTMKIRLMNGIIVITDMIGIIVMIAIIVMLVMIAIIVMIVMSAMMIVITMVIKGIGMMTGLTVVTRAWIDLVITIEISEIVTMIIVIVATTAWIDLTIAINMIVTTAATRA
ncbi:cell surface A33 antigen [Denticeps clupeoides]|uniref:cell surface A33 antigen n=1 Tax=Denticeps clupeoides TaxID=299321 RepID=UPI0010A53ECE|nr:cell surface A33 antigen-like [Denticeps clupeoides]